MFVDFSIMFCMRLNLNMKDKLGCKVSTLNLLRVFFHTDIGSTGDSELLIEV